ncbi:extracellular solute-binding protein [Bradyrhizobium elkanii]|uniref:extracellular solute-binding protein n=1 Tax=Bradyrhizobium elkanii TaxID=29448 RepID=UPI00144A29E3|nr:extracellular solute-binding protein [Bradyrhizobium elkanii]MCP1927767.1 multiple sugar transport system substrate-binding protein [Bradyrhizobium elkanii]MCS3581624.1 multiple sugar transport system substrate-binding protein [Bradyrhizobium elkanii]MCS3724498.1 multiple sugar transport system substrate-binding protein [Bradyrhizobium elkanii]MCS4008910.1 multiple sugar transport system substrate-binding protein [Bradyrhizobium elkanii USDA 61]BBB94783.1 multiple sugar transport system sub
MHKMVTIASALVMAAGIASAASAEPITLRVGYAFAYRDGAYRELVADEFMRRHPDIKIKLESNAIDCPALLQQILRSAITNDLPDVTASTCYPDMQLLADRGIIKPIDEFIENDKTWKEVGVADAALNTVKWHGKTVGLPEAISMVIVYYNMSLIKQAKPEINDLPKNWDEIFSLAGDVRAINKDVMPIFFEYYPDNYNWSFNALNYSFGGNVFDENGKIAFDGDAGMHALGVLQRLGKGGMVDITSVQGTQAFQAGKIAICVSSSSYLRSFSVAAESKFDLRTTPFPQSAPNGKLPSGGFGLVMTTKDPAKQQAAWEFMKFAVGPEAQTLLVKNTGFTPINTKATGSPEYLGDFYKTKPNYLAAVNSIPRVKPQNIYPGENGAKITTIIRDHLQSVVTLKRTPSEEMPDMVRDVTALLPKK